jgi:hypothetical protein
MVHEIADSEIAVARVGGHDGVAIKGQVRLGRRQHRSGFLLRPIEHVAARRGHDGMRLAGDVSRDGHRDPKVRD